MASKAKALNLMRIFSGASCRCPKHAGGLQHHTSTPLRGREAPQHTPGDTDYAFDVTQSSLRYGEGVTQEIGMEFGNMNVKKLAVVVDSNLTELPVMKAVLESLHKNQIEFDVYKDVVIEPTDASFKHAINWAKQGSFDSYLAIGGGSAMDTCKAANLYASNPEADFLDYVNAPIGRGIPITHRLNPLIAIPTTAGTSSETTGVAVFYLKEAQAKTGITSKALKPILGMVDPLNFLTVPPQVATYCGFDVLCHALESYTAIPYNQRSPRPTNPKQRPLYQGSNPVSDVWALHTLKMCNQYMVDSIKGTDNIEAKKQMCAASAFAGFGYGNAGIHLCHGMSYPISGKNKSYHAREYNTDKPLIPHGLSVVITAPAVFEWTAPANPDKHLLAAEALGRDITNDRRSDAGRILGDVLRGYCHKLGIEDGLSGLGFSHSDIEPLSEATIPQQQRATRLAPRENTRDDIAQILEGAMTIY